MLHSSRVSKHLQATKIQGLAIVPQLHPELITVLFYWNEDTCENRCKWYFLDLICSDMWLLRLLEKVLTAEMLCPAALPPPPAAEEEAASANYFNLSPSGPPAVVNIALPPPPGIAPPPPPGNYYFWPWRNRCLSTVLWTNGGAYSVAWASSETCKEWGTGMSLKKNPSCYFSSIFCFLHF